MGIKIEALPPALRAQVEAKLRAEDKRRQPASSPVNAHRIAQDESGCTQTRPETSGRDTRAVARRKRQPNKTEARYAAEMLRGLDARYEAVTFRLSNGHRYTPDWVVFDSAGRLLSCHEVKGSYRFHSHGRARLAFDQAALEFPGITWVWATLTSHGWERRKA
jgi:hypothetical protein